MSEKKLLELAMEDLEARLQQQTVRFSKTEAENLHFHKHHKTWESERILFTEEAVRLSAANVQLMNELTVAHKEILEVTAALIKYKQRAKEGRSASKALCEMYARTQYNDAPVSHVNAA